MKRFLLLSALAVSGTALAEPVDQAKFFDMQRMITDGYQFPTKQEMPRKESRTTDDKNPVPSNAQHSVAGHAAASASSN